MKKVAVIMGSDSDLKALTGAMDTLAELQIPYAVLLGEDEIAAGTAAVKDLATGTQTAVKLEEAAAFIRTGLAAREQGAPIRDKE